MPSKPPVFKVNLTFELMEDVTPSHLAQRVAEACAAYAALRPGEAVISNGKRFIITSEKLATNIFARDRIA